VGGQDRAWTANSLCGMARRLDTTWAEQPHKAAKHVPCLLPFNMLAHACSGERGGKCLIYAFEHKLFVSALPGMLSWDALPSIPSISADSGHNLMALLSTAAVTFSIFHALNVAPSWVALGSTTRWRRAQPVPTTCVLSFFTAGGMRATLRWRTTTHYDPYHGTMGKRKKKKKKKKKKKNIAPEHYTYAIYSAPRPYKATRIPPANMRYYNGKTFHAI